MSNSEIKPSYNYFYVKLKKNTGTNQNQLMENVKC